MVQKAPEMPLVGQPAGAFPDGWKTRLREVNWLEAAIVAVGAVVLWNAANLEIFLIMGVLTILAERLFTYRRQAFFRRAWLTDMAHAVFTSAVAGVIAGLFVLLSTPLFHSVGGALFRPFHVQPLPLQVIETLVLIDLGRYWEHRARHHFEFLWRFHQIHHSAEDLDWMTGKRGHPVDGAIRLLVTVGPLYILGMPPGVVAGYLLVNGAFDMLSHANIRLSLGPFWWLVQNPEFHRIHHEKGREASNSNYAGLFPLFDVVFGTSRMSRPRDNAWGLPYEISMRYIDHLTIPLVGDEA